ncbi:MAG: hypothetical protein ACKVRP_06375 [Bacteroidota bacterium]
MKQMITILSLLSTTFCGGCASTRMTSFTDPDYRQTTFKRILVLANTSDLERRLHFESTMVEVLLDAGVVAIEGFKLFPPTRNLTPERKVELLIQDSIDSYLSISVGESGMEQVYIPPTGSTTTTKGKASVTGNKLEYRGKSTTTIEGGYNFSKPWAAFDVELVDVSTGNTAWVASAFTGGNAFANFSTVINSFCDQTIDQLANDKLIKTREQANREAENDSKLLKKKQSERESPDMVYLKDGSTIRGIIIAEVKSGGKMETITIRDHNGQVRTLGMSEIDRILKK